MQIVGFFAIGDLDEPAQHLLVRSVDGKGALSLVVVERHVSQSLVTVQRVDRKRKPALPGIHYRLQFRQVSSVLFLCLELEDGFGEAVIHGKTLIIYNVWWVVRHGLLKSERAIDRGQGAGFRVVESDVHLTALVLYTCAGIRQLLPATLLPLFSSFLWIDHKIFSL